MLLPLITIYYHLAGKYSIKYALKIFRNICTLRSKRDITSVRQYPVSNRYTIKRYSKLRVIKVKLLKQQIVLYASKEANWLFCGVEAQLFKCDYIHYSFAFFGRIQFFSYSFFDHKEDLIHTRQVCVVLITSK